MYKINFRIFDDTEKIKPEILSLEDVSKILDAISKIILNTAEKKKLFKDKIHISALHNHSIGLPIIIEDSSFYEETARFLMDGFANGFDESYEQLFKPISLIIDKHDGKIQIVDNNGKSSNIVSKNNPFLFEKKEILSERLEKISGYFILGQLTSIGGSNENDISVKIKDYFTNKIINCKISNKELAISLASNLYKKVGLYGKVELKNNQIDNFLIEDFKVKENLDPKGLFNQVSSVLKEDEFVKQLLNAKDLSLYFKTLRDE
jgi:hypothetical protein